MGLSSNRSEAVQQEISRLEDLLSGLAGSSPVDVMMTVAATSPAIPHGGGVGMVSNNVVAPDDRNFRWAGVNVGPDAKPGERIKVRGGTPAEVFISANEGIVAGSLLYFSVRNPGQMTSVIPQDNPPPLGIAYDVSTYDSVNGGIVKAMLNANYGIRFVPVT